MCYSEREIYANSRRELIHEFVNDSDADLKSYVYCMGFDISFLTYSLCRPLYFGVTGRPLVAYYNL